MKEIFMGTGMRLAVATALVCGVTLGGVTLFSDSGGSLSNGVDYTPAQTVFRGSAPHVSATSSAPRTNMSVVAHPTIHLSGSGTSSGAAAASSASASGSSLYTSASSQSVGSSAAPLVTFSDGSNGGGVYVSGSSGGGGGGVAISSGGGGHSSGAISSAGSGGGGAAVIAPKRFGSQSNNDIFSGLEVYNGDKPGEITGTENEVTENTIVTSYGQPIGDALLPLLLMTIIYLIIKRKTMKQQLMHTLLRSQHHHAGLLTLCALLLLPCTRVWAGQETVTYKDVHGNDSAVTYNVVYLNSSSGDDANDGSSSAPVKTLAKAYSKLPAFNTATDDRDAAWDSNIIVVAGSVALNSGVTESATGNRPATITGVWPWNATNTTVNKVDGGGKLTLSGVNSGGRIGADTKFKYVKFGSGGCLSLYLHDCTFDVGCLMNGAGELPTSNGALSGRKTANIQLFLLADPYAFTETPDGGWSNIMKKPVTLTMRSGKFGRILCTRITGTTDELVKKRYVVGNPEHPLLAVINVDMDPGTTEGDWNKGYVDDIAFLCAGTTQGTVYADVQMNIKRGKISSLVAGSQGNAIAACESAGVPTSTYIGRTTINLIGKTDDDVQIYRYFGGCLGRLTGDGASGECKAYYYGQSILNLTHGTIERDLYASGGGLSGLKSPNNDTQYTTDTRIPYQGGSKPNYPYMGIDYSDYNASKTIVSVKSDLYSSQETINLAESKITFNINGGIIKGNVYGGSYGYSEDMTAGAAPTGAGSLWGNTEVNISGGTIQGSVYAGGGGTTEYYTKSTSNEMRAKYLEVATVYGNTNLTITGAPNIAGNIYGGGAGVASTGAVGTDTEFLNIGKVYGNTNVTIDADADWEFTGNIYGGGAKGAVEGNTNVTILGGIINGKVFGAGQGEEGHPNKAKVTGTTNVVVGATPAP